MGTSPPALEGWVRSGTLGRGTFGRVTLWKHQITHEAIAIKECLLQLNPRNRQRWKEEIEMLTQKQHPNLVAVREIPPAFLAVLNSTEPCLGMEHCEGGDLRKVLTQPAHCTGLNEYAVLNILKDVTNAVRFLHSHKIIHRDLKPENILISFIGDKVVYKITDLGYAKHLDQNSVADSFVGTMKYVAPEVFSSEEGYNVTADYWSLGNVIFESITGYRPFDFEKSFVEWHSIVKSKEPEDICACCDAGQIEFKTSIPLPNKLSSPLVPMFEEWLRLVMEWDPKLRGGEKDEKGIRRCYHVADKILDTKVVHVFCVNNCKFVSFQVNEDDFVHQLEEKVAEFYEDTDASTLILPNGETPDSVGALMQCYNQPGDEWLIYAMNSNKLSQRRGSRPTSGGRNVYEDMPDKVRTMVENPDKQNSFTELKRLWGQALYFCSELAKCYRTLLQAQRAVMITLMNCNSSLMQEKEAMIAEVHKLTANIDMFIERDIGGFLEVTLLWIHPVHQNLCRTEWTRVYSCKDDLHHFHQIGFHRNSANKPYADEIKKMIEEAETYQENLVEEIGRQVTKAQRELINLKNSPLVTNQNTELDKMAQYAKTEYEKLEKLEKASQDPPNSQYMANLILRVLTDWERVESNFYTQLGKVMICKANMEELLPEVQGIISRLKENRERLKTMMKRKQEMTWKTLTLGSTPGSSLSSSGYDSMAYALTSILEEVKKEPTDPVSIVDENKTNLDRLGELVQSLKSVSSLENLDENFSGSRRRSANASLQTVHEENPFDFQKATKRRTISDPHWRRTSYDKVGNIEYNDCK